MTGRPRQARKASSQSTETPAQPKASTKRSTGTKRPNESEAEDQPASGKKQKLSSPEAKPARVRKTPVKSSVRTEATETVTTSKTPKQRAKITKLDQATSEDIKQDLEIKIEHAEELEPDTNGVETASKKGKRKAKSKTAAGSANVDSVADVKPKVKRKTKEEKEAEQMPLAQRTLGHKLFIGAHVSASGGVHKAVLNSVHIGANAFALFLKSQRKWTNPPLVDEVASQFHAHCKSHTYDAGKHVVPHGSYLVNLAHTDATRTKQAYESFLDDLQRCERLGIKLYNFHPGNTTGGDRAAAIKHLASNINRAHKETKTVVTLLENMAAGGNIIGTTFEDLHDTIEHIDDKSRVGVCLDTCHAFAAGYDLRTPDAFKATLERFDKVVGLQYLRALHVNDSKAPFESHRDLHAQIGTGYLGLRAFHNIVNEPHFVGLPMVLETPTTTTDDDGEPLKDDNGKVKEDAASWAREIKLLESLVGMDTESEEFKTLEESLARKGAKERQRIGEQAERRKVKEAKKAAKGKQKTSDSEESDFEDDD